MRSARVYVVAGGATGIGAATAERLAAGGAHVVVGDINARGARATVEGIRATGGTATAVTFDISEERSVNALIAAATDTYGRLDGVHVNAADLSRATVGRDTDAVDIDLAVWDRTMSVGLRGHLLVARAAIPQMLKAGGGGLVFTSSAEAFTGSAARVAYGTAKAGVNALARHISGRWGKEGIRANAVAPGLVVTETIRAGLDLAAQDQAMARLRSTRNGRPDDIAAIVAFLLSDDGEWINGQSIAVNGGLHLLT